MQIKLNVIYLVSIFAIALSSCSALNKQQKTAIKEFAASAKIYTEAPKELVTTYSDCLYKSDKLDAALKETSEGVVNDLDRAVKDKFNRTAFSSELNITYRLLDKYFQALLNFADIDTADGVKTNISTLGINIDSLISKSSNIGINTIPLGFGTIAGNLFKYIGKNRIRQQQLKYFKQFVGRGDVLLQRASSILDSIIINSLIRGGLENRNNQANTDFLRYLDRLEASGKKPSDYLKDLNPIYLDIKDCYAKAILLTKQLSEVTKRLTGAHGELVLLLNSKQKKINATKIAGFIESVGQLNELMKKLKELDK